MAYIAHEQAAVNGISGLGMPSIGGYMKHPDLFDRYARRPFDSPNGNSALKPIGSSIGGLYQTNSAITFESAARTVGYDSLGNLGSAARTIDYK